MFDALTDTVISITRKGWLPRDKRHPSDIVEYVLFLFRYPRWIFRFFLWIDPPYRKGDPWKRLSLDQWSKYVDVYFGLERPVAEQHLSSRRIVQRKFSEWFYIAGLFFIIILCWVATAWQQHITAPVRHLWPLEWIVILYVLPLFAFAIDWVKYRTKYWHFDLRETHGTARWKRFDELKNKHYLVPRGTKLPGHAYVAPYNAIYDLVFPFEEMFRSRLFVGKPGSGKSSTFHANHLRFYAKDFNAVAVDIKGELYQLAAHYYDSVYRLDFRDPCYSDRFNLIRDCRGDITFTSKIAYTLIVTSNKEAANSQNKYFYDAAKAVLTALILHLAEDSEHYPEATLNDLFYVLAGEYRVATEYDRQYYVNRVIEWLEADPLFGFIFNVGMNPPPQSLGNFFAEREERRIRYLRSRIRKVLLSEQSMQAKTIYLLYMFDTECYRMIMNICLAEYDVEKEEEKRRNKNKKDESKEKSKEESKEKSKDKSKEESEEEVKKILPRNEWVQSVIIEKDKTEEKTSEGKKEKGEEKEEEKKEGKKERKNSENYLKSFEKKISFNKSRWGRALIELGKRNNRVEIHEVNWEKEFPSILEFVGPESIPNAPQYPPQHPHQHRPQHPPQYPPQYSGLVNNINKFLGSPEKCFEKIYHMLSSLSPTRPDYREVKRGQQQMEYREEGYFLDKESGRVAVFLTQMFRTSPSLQARQSWASFQSSAGNDPRLLGNITSTLLTAIECFRDPTVNLCFRNPTPEEKARGCRIVDWDFLRGQTPTALFLVMSAAQSIQLAPVVATIFSVIMEKLLRELNDPTGEKKLRPCYLQVDEGGNFKIPNIAEFVATCRGSAVCVDYSVQSVLQLNHLYGHDYGEMVKEVFGTKIFLPGSEGKTAELVAHLGGELTTRQRKIVDAPGNWLDREEDQEVKRHLIDGYEARTLARHLEVLCLMSDEPAIRLTFPPFARDIDPRLTEPKRFATDNVTEVRSDFTLVAPNHLTEEVMKIIEENFKSRKTSDDGQGHETDEGQGEKTDNAGGETESQKENSREETGEHEKNRGEGEAARNFSPGNDRPLPTIPAKEQENINNEFFCTQVNGKEFSVKNSGPPPVPASGVEMAPPGPPPMEAVSGTAVKNPETMANSPQKDGTVHRMKQRNTVPVPVESMVSIPEVRLLGENDE